MIRWPRRLLGLCAILLTPAAIARADYVQTLHTFTGGADDGAAPGNSRLVEGRDGYIYGVTQSGGANNSGTFFRIARNGAGFTVLHAFADHSMPTWLIQGRDGNFYGTDYQHGDRYGGYTGSVFRIAPDGTYSTALKCWIPGDGYNPIAVLEASNGWMYALMTRGGMFPATSDGGTRIQYLTDGGTVVQFKPGTPCGYAYQFPPWLFYYLPGSYLIQASDGNLYGVKSPARSGAFRYPIASGGQVTMFDASGISNGVEEGPDGAFYGVSDERTACGRVDRMTMSTHTVVYAFDCSREAGRATAAPMSGGDGYLYGTTQSYFYRLNTAGTEYTPLAAMSDGAAGPLLHASDGLWYGMTAHTIFRVVQTPGTGFDADAIADMPLYDATTGVWRILTSGSGYYSSLQISWGGPEYTPVPADYDGDGRMDLGVYHAGRSLWYVLTSSSNFTGAFMKTLGGPPFSPVPGDYDGDRRADVAVMRTGVLTFVESSTLTTRSFTVGARGDVPVRGDFDGDGKADAAVYRPATGAWRILTSASSFSTLVTASLGGPGHTPVTGDYDGDHRTDAAVYNAATGDWSVLQSSTGTTVTVGWGGTGYAPVPGDYDADGKNDLAVYAAAAGAWYVLRSSSGFTTVLYEIWGTPTESPVTALPARVAWTDTLRATDFDGDGASDIAVYEPSSGNWTILTSSSHFTLARTLMWGGAGLTPVPGDYDGDGLTDLATFGPTGLWSAQLSSGGVLMLPLGSPGDMPVARDYDGDGITDLAVYTPSTGLWRRLLSTSHFTPGTPAVGWGGVDWTPVPGDYDGDGQVDLGLYHQASGGWRVLLAAANFTTSLGVDWGGPAYTAVPGDFDGDGRNDLGLSVTPAGQWYVLQSGLNYATSLGRSWGAAIDTPRSADYDGDGIADMANYDAATGEWRVLLSSSYFTLPMVRTLGGTGFVLPE